MLTNYQNFDTILPTVTNRLPKNYIIEYTAIKPYFTPNYFFDKKYLKNE